MSDIPVAVLLQLRKIPKYEAAAILDTFDLSPEQHENYMKVAGKDLPADMANTMPPIDYRAMQQYNARANTVDPHRRRWLAVAYLLGASYRMLAKAYGITHQSIKQGIDKEIDEETKSTKRIGFMLSPERITEYREGYYKNVSALSRMSPLEAATWLHYNIKPDAEDIDLRYEE